MSGFNLLRGVMANASFSTFTAPGTVLLRSNRRMKRFSGESQGTSAFVPGFRVTVCSFVSRSSQLSCSWTVTVTVAVSFPWLTSNRPALSKTSLNPPYSAVLGSRCVPENLRRYFPLKGLTYSRVGKALTKSETISSRPSTGRPLAAKPSLRLDRNSSLSPSLP